MKCPCARCCWRWSSAVSQFPCEPSCQDLLPSKLLCWEKTTASFQVPPVCFPLEALPQCLGMGWQLSCLASAGQLSGWLKDIRGKLIVCQHSSAPTHIREGIQLSLWPTRRLAGQAIFANPAVQLDARARPSGVQKAEDRGITRGCLCGHPGFQGCILHLLASYWIDQGCWDNLLLFFLILSHLLLPVPFSPSFLPFPSPPSSLQAGEDALRSTQSLWNSLWEKVGEVCNLIRQPRKSQAMPHSPSLLGSKCSLRNPVWGLMRPC